METSNIDDELCEGRLCLSFWLAHLVAQLSNAAACDAFFQPDYMHYFLFPDEFTKGFTERS